MLEEHQGALDQPGRLARDGGCRSGSEDSTRLPPCVLDHRESLAVVLVQSLMLIIDRDMENELTVPGITQSYTRKETETVTGSTVIIIT